MGSEDIQPLKEKNVIFKVLSDRGAHIEGSFYFHFRQTSCDGQKRGKHLLYFILVIILLMWRSLCS